MVPGGSGRPGYDPCQTGHGGPHQRHYYSCRELLCVAMVPCVLLSLVAIGICSLLIYFHLLQEYQSKIDRLQAELQAVRDKDGAVYLPQEMYDEQNRKLESQEAEIRKMTKEWKNLEIQRDDFKVRHSCQNYRKCPLKQCGTSIKENLIVAKLCYAEIFHSDWLNI